MVPCLGGFRAGGSTQRAWNYSCPARPSHNLGNIAWTHRWGPACPSLGSHCKMKDACEARVKFRCSSIVRNSLRIPFTIVSGLWGTARIYQVLLVAGVLNKYFSLEGECSSVPLWVSVLQPRVTAHKQCSYSCRCQDTCAGAITTPLHQPAPLSTSGLQTCRIVIPYLITD